MAHTHATSRGRHAAPRRRHAAPKPPRRIGRRLRIGAALITAAGLLGAGCTQTPTDEAVATAGRSAEPQATVTVTAQPVASDAAGDECREYADWILEQMDAKDQIVLDAFMQMADILDRDGFMVTSEYVSIVNQATADMDELTTKMLTGPGFYCPAEG